MTETNQSRSQYVIDDIDVRIERQKDITGVGRTSQLQPRLDHVNDLNEAYKPAIEGLDTKIVSIGQSINQVKDEIVTLVLDAVGISTVFTCAGFASTGAGGVCTSWTGGMSTCLTGYVPEYYDSVTAYIWPFSPNSNNPFSPQTTEVLTNASNSYTVGVGTFILHQSNNSSYLAGARVGLGSSSTCLATQNEINRKDGEISVLRTEIADYITKVNAIRTDKVNNQLEEWGSKFAIEESKKETTRLENVKTVYTDPKYRNLFLQ